MRLWKYFSKIAKDKLEEKRTKCVLNDSADTTEPMGTLRYKDEVYDVNKALTKEQFIIYPTFMSVVFERDRVLYI